MAIGLRHGAPLTYADLQGMPDDGYRRELLDGALLVTPSPGAAHQRMVGELYVRLRAAARPDEEVLVAPYDWKLSDGTVFQPDLLVMRREDVGEKGLERTPLLVVEVLSPSTRMIDWSLKRQAYEAAGVAAYWIADPAEPSVAVLQLEGGRLVEVAHVASGEVHETDRPFPVRIAPSDLAG